MIKKIYIDNYKCFSNFEIELSNIQLFLGDNGSGKSALFEVLSILRSFIVEGKHVSELFNPLNCTRWDSRNEQTFEIHIEEKRENSKINRYLYSLIILFESNGRFIRIREEKFHYNGTELYKSVSDGAQFKRNMNSPIERIVVSRSRSGFIDIPEVFNVEEDSPYFRFRRYISKIFCIQISPFDIEAESNQEKRYLEKNASNFSSWYRYCIQENPNLVSKLRETLEEAIPGSSNLRPEDVGGASRKLVMDMGITVDKKSSKSITLDINDFSDGQRVLIVLYTLLYWAIYENSVLCIDEPNNFVALREIQPWLSLVRDKVEESYSQVLIISHHPEVIDFLSCDSGVKFYRHENGPVRTKHFSVGESNVLKASEIIARGWDDEK